MIPLMAAFALLCVFCSVVRISASKVINTDVHPYAKLRPGQLLAFYPFDGDMDDYAPVIANRPIEKGLAGDKIGTGYGVTLTPAAKDGPYA